MLNDDRGRAADPEGERPATPEEIEAVEEFETVPQVASHDPAQPHPAPGAPTPASLEAQAPPPSAVEAFDRPAPPTGAATPAAVPPATVAAMPAVAVESTGTRCPRCGTENQPGIAFCRNCGQRLVAPGAATVARPGAPEGMQTCPRCGTVNRLGIAFCQNCGAGLRASEPAAQPATASYVPPAVNYGGAPQQAAASRRAPAERAVLGPMILLIGAVGLSVAWALPFAYGGASLFTRALGPDGYGIAFWTAYDEIGGALADQAYFGAAAPVPLLVGLLVLLALGGFVRGRPGWFQVIGLLLALAWIVTLGASFVIVEVLGADAGAFTALLRALSAAGMIFVLSSIVAAIGVLTRFARS